MTPGALSEIYAGYIDCLNVRDWSSLQLFVHEEVRHNDRPLGLSGYREMLESDCRAIPDLRFDVGLMVSQPPRIAARLRFDCTPAGTLFGLPVDGRRVKFDENVIYEFLGARIHRVWSVIDTAAISAQLCPET